MIVGLAILVVLVAVAATFLLTATFVGMRLPVAHRVSRSARYAEPIEKVWDAVSDPRSARAFGALRFEQATPVPGRILVRRLVGERDFGGTWTYELEPDGSGTCLTITEDGEVRSPLLRFLSRFVLGHARTIESYLEDLRRGL